MKAVHFDVCKKSPKFIDKKGEINASKIYSPVGKCAEWAKKTTQTHRQTDRHTHDDRIYRTSITSRANESRDVTTPLSGMVCRPYRLQLAVVNLCTKYEVSMLTYYEDTKKDEKCRNWGDLGIMGHRQHSHSIERIRLPIRL